MYKHVIIQSDKRIRRNIKRHCIQFVALYKHVVIQADKRIRHNIKRHCIHLDKRIHATQHYTNPFNSLHCTNTLTYSQTKESDTELSVNPFNSSHCTNTLSYSQTKESDTAIQESIQKSSHCTNTLSCTLDQKEFHRALIKRESIQLATYTAGAD